ncbi:MAG: DUF2871 domain-containing protein [Eubacteriaceae bacterium]|nr:DUF2871 domain-containing protein [Eubacteriaceae bacterium]
MNKKCLNISLCYAIAAMIGGVFYREFTKYNSFTGVTVLGKIHVHLFLLGMIVFLLAALFAKQYDLASQKKFHIFLKVYNIGVPLTVIMLIIRGIFQVQATTLSAGADAAISGIAGIGHILVGIGLIFFILSLKTAASLKTSAKE